MRKTEILRIDYNAKKAVNLSINKRVNKFTAFFRAALHGKPLTQLMRKISQLLRIVIHFHLLLHHPVIVIFAQKREVVK